ncbi:MAG: hypothetical protein PHR35_21430, partial [Kiritimatiellae bacterium]|nr:hypothetical protein [Kiritimatiellia bacterium]
TGRLYNPLYQDPQRPESKRHTPGNRGDYSAETVNVKYIPNILAALGAELPLPCHIEAHAALGEDTFDRLWAAMAEWSSSHAGMFPVTAALELEKGEVDRIPQIEAGMGALIRAYSRETGMWRPEPLRDFPWRDYPPSSGFKIVGRICGYLGMENFPADVLRTAVDNLLAHRGELHAHPAMARNYGETFLHFILMSDYRREEQLDAMEECLEGFRDPRWWEQTGDGSYCMFSSSQVGPYLHYRELSDHSPQKQASQAFDLHGCRLRWRFVADPFGHWVNVMPKEPEAVFGHPRYDITRHNLKARNQAHWAKKVTELAPPRNVALRLNADGATGEGSLRFHLAREQQAAAADLLLKASWRGAYDVRLNGERVKQVRYDLPDLPAGWTLPAAATGTLRAGDNIVTVHLLGPGREPKPGAALSTDKPFIRLGLMTWA